MSKSLQYSPEITIQDSAELIYSFQRLRTLRDAAMGAGCRNQPVHAKFDRKIHKPNLFSIGENSFSRVVIDSSIENLDGMHGVCFLFMGFNTVRPSKLISEVSLTVLDITQSKPIGYSSIATLHDAGVSNYLLSSSQVRDIFMISTKPRYIKNPVTKNHLVDLGQMITGLSVVFTEPGLN